MPRGLLLQEEGVGAHGARAARVRPVPRLARAALALALLRQGLRLRLRIAAAARQSREPRLLEPGLLPGRTEERGAGERKASSQLHAACRR